MKRKRSKNDELLWEIQEEFCSRVGSLIEETIENYSPFTDSYDVTCFLDEMRHLEEKTDAICNAKSLKVCIRKTSQILDKKTVQRIAREYQTRFRK